MHLGIMLYVAPIQICHLHLSHHYSLLRYLSYAVPSKDYSIVIELPVMVRWCSERAAVGADYWGIPDLLMSSDYYYIWAVEHFNLSHRTTAEIIIVRRAGLLWSQQDFEWWWSVPSSSASLY